MKNAIYDIVKGNNIESILDYTLNDLFIKGPISTTNLEILSYLNIYQKEIFQKNTNTILNILGVNYKSISADNLKSEIFRLYTEYLKTEYGFSYTPVQANIVKEIKNNQCFSFSAPTSTGKSYVFRNIIKSCENDVIIIVPSRALINEYYVRLLEEITNKDINILTSIDKVNTAITRRNIFIVTPERCKDLFKQNPKFNVDFFLFDEAQLSDEESIRGLYFDSIIRRIQKSYPESRFVFAHPFVENPEAQILKNHFDSSSSHSYQYTQRNVGQIFYVQEEGQFYHFGIDKEIMGKRKVRCNFDPMFKTLDTGGSILVYTSKSSIYNKKVFTSFHKYIERCSLIKDPKALKLIEEVKEFIGASDDVEREKYSNMINMLKRGIVVHHGSLPLQARMILEKFTQAGYCRICFATSTLEQGVNMPFDVVYLNTFHASKPLSIKNLIGRAGRSTGDVKFDYGSIIIKKANMSNFRKIMSASEKLKEVSMFDEDLKNEDYLEFKEAILNDTISDEYNLTTSQIEKLSVEESTNIIEELIESMFSNGELLSLEEISSENKLKIRENFVMLYENYLGRRLFDGEKNVLKTAIRILLWKVHSKTFKEICYYRYAHASRQSERFQLKKEIEESSGDEKNLKNNVLNNLYANFVTECNDIPNKKLSVYSMFGHQQTKAAKVDYDRIVFDTYDYLDKIVGFQLSDIFYAAFDNYYKKTEDERAKTFSLYLKYGTDKTDEIWLLRYGFSFEDIEWIKPHIESINQESINFLSSISDVDSDKLTLVKRFIQ